jgi:hypothetical protein
MALPDIKIEKLKNLTEEEQFQTISEYEEKKIALIEQYMELQDIVDEYNEKIYKITCEIEQINFVLKEMEPMDKSGRA